jgi:hypothetical protein
MVRVISPAISGILLGSTISLALSDVPAYWQVPQQGSANVVIRP